MNIRNLKLAFNLAMLVLMTTFFTGIAMATEEEAGTGTMRGNAIMMSGWMENI